MNLARGYIYTILKFENTEPYQRSVDIFDSLHDILCNLQNIGVTICLYILRSSFPTSFFSSMIMVWCELKHVGVKVQHVIDR